MNDSWPERIEAIAQTAHAALRAWALAHGQADIPEWQDAPEWMHTATREGVKFSLENPDADGEAHHRKWMAVKLGEGWRYGPEKSDTAKTHPLIVPYEDVPEWQRRKDVLIHAIVRALA